MLRKLILSAGCVAAMAVSAQAADMAVKGPPRTYAPVGVNWNGLYVGANLGYASARINPGFLSGTDHLDGVNGGAQIGYNWQFVGSPLLLGIEADIQASAQEDSVGGVGSIKAPWFGTVRGRLGYVAGSWMPYITGGYAFARAEARLTGIGSGSTTADGYTIGGGIEWMVAPRWSIKAEYLYMNFGNEDITIAGVTGTGKVTNNLGRVGINYHF
jgi:outer membrane immunogenic protein